MSEISDGIALVKADVLANQTAIAGLAAAIAANPGAVDPADVESLAELHTALTSNTAEIDAVIATVTGSGGTPAPGAAGTY